MQDFDPGVDEVDKILLYMLTGRRREGSVTLDWVNREAESG